MSRNLHIEWFPQEREASSLSSDVAERNAAVSTIMKVTGTSWVPLHPTPRQETPKTETFRLHQQPQNVTIQQRRPRVRRALPANITLRRENDEAALNAQGARVTLERRNLAFQFFVEKAVSWRSFREERPP